MQTLLIDNYDSFTFNLYHIIAEVSGVAPMVVPNSTPWPEIRQLAFDNIVLSPGPGRPDNPADFGVCAEAILRTDVPLLGVCLGHQGLCHLFGATIDYADQIMHGRASAIHHSQQGLFHGLPSPFSAIRYHSLQVTHLPTTLRRTAWTADNTIMGVEHIAKPMWGVQFHPESIGTENGRQLIANFCALTNQHWQSHPRHRRLSDGVQPRRARDNCNVMANESVGSQQPRICPARLRGRPFEFHVRRIPVHIEPENLFSTVYAGTNPCFWLDSALVTTSSRFSYMGDTSGPHAEFVSYDMATQTLAVRRNNNVVSYQDSIFSYLERSLEERRTHVDGLPFEFNLGYVGYFGYELKGECGGDAPHPSPTADAAFVFADRMVVIDHKEGVIYLICLDHVDHKPRATAWLDGMERKIHHLGPLADSAMAPSRTSAAQTFRHNNEDYLALIRESKRYIREGESYEICLTNSIVQDITIDALETYRALRNQNPAPHAAYLNFPEVAVLSSSPEIFLRIQSDGLIESKPIKGTRRRGKCIEEDERLYEDLRSHEKDRCENLMIVDLLRNDLGKVSDVGSVDVHEMFAVETYATVHQLVSTVRGRRRPGISTIECIKAAFPGGSMTGAPKKRTMEILDRLEGGARGIYSGAIGFLALNGGADLSMAIRTIVATPESVTVGVGGAIVDLSDPEKEWEEILLKSHATTAALACTAGTSNNTQEGRQTT